MGVAVRHRLASTRLAAVVAFAIGQWSTTYADSSFKIVTAPSDAQQAPATADSSFKIVTPPGDGVNLVRTKGEQTADERAKSEGYSQSEAILPRLAIQRILLRPGTGRQIDFGRNFASIFLSNNQAIDAVPINDHQLFVRPLDRQTTVVNGNTTYTNSETRSEGVSQIFAYDDQSKLIGVIEVIIDPFAYNINQPLEDPAMATYQFRPVTIYPGSDLRGPFRYRCLLDTCEFAGK
jgi:hypothetical protein